MSLHRVFVVLSGWVLLASGLTGQRSFAVPPVETIARVHWQGMNRVSADTNAVQFMKIWQLPPTKALMAQTLDKLSLAPWRLLHRGVETNAAALLRPVLDDVLANECYLQIRSITGQPEQWAFAIRLDDRRAALWQTNLARVMESLTAIRSVAAPKGSYGWSLKKHHAPDLIELTRVGGWTVVGAAEDFNSLVAELRARTQRNLPPWNVRSGSDWLEADLNPARLVPVLTTLNPQPSTFNQFSRLYFAVTGDGTNVLTHGTMDFSEPLALELKPWIVPTNLIADPITGITLVRGFKPRLESLTAWKNLQIGPAPDQVCVWGMQQFPMETYFAAPLPDAGNEVSKLSDWVLQKQSPTNQLVRFEKSVRFNGLEWKGAPFATPFVRSVMVSHQDFIFGGGLAATVPGTLTLEALQTSLVRTNLVYHDWEATGLRTDQWLYLTQFVRFILRKDQLPSGSASVLWLKTVGPKLGRSATDITQTGSNQLSFMRQSDVGFTALELNLLADWLESPQFPLGLYSLLTPPSIRL
jgi:hypothetical protein